MGKTIVILKDEGVTKMKRLFMIVLILALIVSCTKPPVQEPVDEQKKVEDYFPFLENTKLSYEGIGNEYAEKDVYFDFIEGNRAQLRVSNPGTTVAQIYEVNEGEVRLLSSMEEMYVFYNTMERLTGGSQKVEEAENIEVLLKEPLVAGTKWSLSEGRTREITGVDVDVDTPHKDYKAIEVTTVKDGEAVSKDYYAEGVGLIKSIFISDAYEITTTLEAIEKNTGFKQAVRFYYPDFNNEEIVYVEDEIEFKTNDDIKGLFERRFKEAPGEDVNRVIGDNVKINEIIYNPEDGSITVDFTRSLVTEMNAGIYLESQILGSITNTFGGYFNVTKVYIRLDSQTYESGHVYLEVDEYLTPRLEASKPYKKE